MIFTQPLEECREIALVGGKAANLGRLLRAGFSVPGGFVITTVAYRHARTLVGQPTTEPPSLPPDVADAIHAAYQLMGAGPVAVRSSATAEDMASASMAGQYETFLNIAGADALLDAVSKCWASLNAPRIEVYLREHGIDPLGVAMAVIVQRLVAADVAGVLFTANPHAGTRREMLVEASWGLGESVVSGRVQPDVLRMDHDTGRVLSATIADKNFQIPANGHDAAIDLARRKKSSLRGPEVHQLWHLGRRVAEHFGSPQDIEWAIGAGQLYLLQSRPITTLEEAEAYEDVLRTAREQMRDGLAAGRGPWVLHNLAQTLPHPTPLTWSLISRFMAGAGGFGEMYRLAGFVPAPSVERAGFLDLIGGRIYMDASRAAEMFFENFPFTYDLEELRQNPDPSQMPPTVPRGSFRARMKAARSLGRVNATLQKIAVDFDRQLNDRVFPQFAEWCGRQKNRDLSSLTTEQLIETWSEHEKKILDEFAPQSLLPGLIGGMALAELQTFLQEHFWDQDAEALAQLITSAGSVSRTVMADAELYEVAQGNRPLAAWLASHGHRRSGRV